MTGLFNCIVGGMTLYTSSEANVRFCLARYGEDAARVVEAFWKEPKAGDFVVVPVFAYGLPPREELCTKQSLTNAYGKVALQPGSHTEQEWVRLLKRFGVRKQKAG